MAEDEGEEKNDKNQNKQKTVENRGPGDGG